MPNWGEEFLNGGQANRPEEPPNKWGAAFMGQELRNPSGPVKWGNIQATDSPETAAPMARNLGAGMMPNEQDQIRYYAQRRFPNLPEAEAVKRYGIIDGNIVYGNGEGGYSREVPSVFGGPTREIPGRAMNWLASQIGPCTPGAAGAVTGTVMGPTGLSIPAAGVASGITDVVRQAIGNMMTGKPATNIDLLNAGGQALLGAGGQAAGVGARSLMERNPLRISSIDRKDAADPMFRADVKLIEDEARRRGIKLSAAQATDLKSLLNQERQLGRGNATADLMDKWFTNQRQVEVPTAIRDEIANISDVTGQEARTNVFRGGADVTKQAAFDERQKVVQPLYQEAFDANQNMQSAKIDRILNTPAGKDALRRTATKMQNDMTLLGTKDADLTEQAREVAAMGGDAVPRQGVASGLKLRTYDYIKKSLDDMAEAAARAGNNDDARIIGNLKRDLVSEVDRLDVTGRAGPNSLKPEGGAYKRARMTYGVASDAIDAIINGKTGEIAKMEGEARINILNRAFSATQIMPEQMNRLRNAFSMAGKLDDFNSGLAGWLDNKLADAMKVNANGKVGNVAGKFTAEVWGDPRQQAVIKAALGDPARAEGFGRFMEVLRRAGSSLAEGSPTATDMGAQLTPRGILGQSIHVLRSPLESLETGIINMRDPKKRRALAEAMLGGDYDTELKKLRLVSPVAPQSLATVSRILAAFATPKPDDFAAPVSQQQGQR